MKKFFVLSLLLVIGNIALSEELYDSSHVNMTPSSTFSGYKNNSSRNIYPKLNYNYSAAEKRRQELLKPKSVHDMDTSSVRRDLGPMKLESIPNNYDSSDQLHTPGLRNLQNVNMYF